MRLAERMRREADEAWLAGYEAGDRTNVCPHRRADHRGVAWRRGNDDRAKELGAAAYGRHRLDVD